jgi:hypothetical protein
LRDAFDAGQLLVSASGPTFSLRFLFSADRETARSDALSARGDLPQSIL